MRSLIPDGVRKPTSLAVIVAADKAAYKRDEDGVYVIPITSLGDNQNN